MSATTVSYRTPLAVSAAEAFRWHTRPGALKRLTPPWEPVQVLERTGDDLSDGARVTLEIRRGPLRRHWVSEPCGYRQDEQCCDVQIAGPFARWDHIHRFAPDGTSACFLEDRITYALPLNMVVQPCAGTWVHRKLARLCASRHQITQHNLAAHAAYRADKPRHILMTGASGLVGAALIPFLNTDGQCVSRLVCSTPRPDQGEIRWQPATGSLATPALEGVDAVVHLAGENIAAGSGTIAYAAQIDAAGAQPPAL